MISWPVGKDEAREAGADQRDAGPYLEAARAAHGAAPTWGQGFASGDGHQGVRVVVARGGVAMRGWIRHISFWMRPGTSILDPMALAGSS